MDKIDDEVIQSMNKIASTLAMVSDSKIEVDYENEIIKFCFSDKELIANCRYDSQPAAIRDFAKQILMQIDL